ncbi:DNA-binding protein, partial [Dysosmobacter welbionis]
DLLPHQAHRRPGPPRLPAAVHGPTAGRGRGVRLRVLRPGRHRRPVRAGHPARGDRGGGQVRRQVRHPPLW